MYKGRHPLYQRGVIVADNYKYNSRYTYVKLKELVFLRLMNLKEL
jgi:hypothetical protein